MQRDTMGNSIKLIVPKTPEVIRIRLKNRFSDWKQKTYFCFRKKSLIVRKELLGRHTLFFRPETFIKWRGTLWSNENFDKSRNAGITRSCDLSSSKKHRTSNEMKEIPQFFEKTHQCHRIKKYITIHMPQRTSKILLVRLTANRNALLFLIRVTSFARYTVWFGVTRSDQTTVNDYFTLSTITKQVTLKTQKKFTENLERNCGKVSKKIIRMLSKLVGMSHSTEKKPEWRSMLAKSFVSAKNRVA